MPEYTEKQKEQRRKAVAEYMKTVDRVNCQFPLGTKERKQKRIKHKYFYMHVLTLGTNKYIIILVRSTAYKSPVRTGERRKHGRYDNDRNS